jgi:hypothetical protein
MKKKHHIPARQKHFDSDTDSAPLVLWLNAMSDSDLHRMVRDLQSLHTLAKAKESPKEFPDSTSVDGLTWSTLLEEDKQKWLEFERLRDSINSRMRQFATYSAIMTSSLYHLPAQARGGGRPLEFRVLSPRGDRRPYDLVRHPYQGSADTPIFESHLQILAFFAFEKVVIKQWAWRLRICDVCGHWFCARTKPQQYCSSPARCSRMKYDHSPKAKIKRQERRALSAARKNLK